MPRPLFDSEYIFGLHEPGGEQHMLDAGKPGWLVFTEAIGSDPNDTSGKNFTPWSNQNLGILCRINNGYEPGGTIPNSAQYADFAKRCANYVRASQGCKLWIIGNEMNYEVERPPASSTRAAARATAQSAVEEAVQSPTTSPQPAPTPEPAENSAWDRFLQWLKQLFGGGQPAAPTKPTPPVNPPIPVESPLVEPSNETDDPLHRSDPRRFDALNQPAASPPQAAGATVRSAAAAALEVINGREVITPELYVQCYKLCRDAIHALPGHADDQVLIGAVAPWNVNSGDWIGYFKRIVELLGPTGCDGITLHTYTHGADPNLVTSTAKMNAPYQDRHYHFRAYRDFMNAIPTNMRSLPVYITETDEDVAWDNRNIQWVQRAYGEIDAWNKQSGAQQIRALVLYRWPPFDKWVIQGKQGVIDDFKAALQNDYRWRSSGATPPPSTGAIKVGGQARTADIVYMRRTPGYRDKPVGDIIANIPTGRVVDVIGGPQSQDELTWWQVRGVDESGANVTGWMAEVAPNGTRLLEAVTGTAPPVAPGKFAIGDTVRTLDVVNLRRTTGYKNKPASDVITSLAAGTEGRVVAGPESKDDLTWWQVQTASGSSTVSGWMAESVSGKELLAKVSSDDSRDTGGAFAIGDTARTTTVVRLRRTPGYLNKPASDTITNVPANTNVVVQAGPQSADALTWWLVKATVNGQQQTGWMAETANGQTLMVKVATAQSASIAPEAASDQITKSAAISTAIRDAASDVAESVSIQAVTDGWQAGDTVKTLTVVRMRRTPGYIGKSASDVMADIPTGAEGKIVSGPSSKDGLIWWQVASRNSAGAAVTGWMAQAVNNTQLLQKTASAAPPVEDGAGDARGETGGRFQIGESVRTTTVVRMRRTTGFLNKPDSDVVIDAPAGTTGRVQAGPQSADGLTWWQVQVTVNGQSYTGWMAEATSVGAQLLESAGGVTPPPTGGTPISTKFKAGDSFKTVEFVRLRRTVGYKNKPDSDVVADIWQNTPGAILGGPQAADQLVWWQVQTRNVDGVNVSGWMADTAPTGATLMEPTTAPPPTTGGGSTGGAFAKDDLVVAATAVRVRQTAGINNKPAGDILGEFAQRTTLNIIDGPKQADNLTWWNVGGIAATGEIIGWVAEAVDGVKLLTRAAKLPGTDIPNQASNIYLGAPTERPFGIAQLWGERPDFYSQFRPGGVPLRGHNGIDFLTPVGTNVVATDNGQVLFVANDPNGFGIHVMLIHSWGRSIYAHLNSAAVSKGQSVRRGDSLGASGNTGASSGPHLHFAIADNPFAENDGWGGFIDPLPYLPPSFVILPPWVLPSAARSVSIAGASRPDLVNTRAVETRMEPSGMTVNLGSEEATK
ncbi:MAG: M23 family metallopeptidase [Caldilineaceae bacterium]|nr:M23 family metallopeptidase [Caldilineaceae bacterium]